MNVPVVLRDDAWEDSSIDTDEEDEGKKQGQTKVTGLDQMHGDISEFQGRHDGEDATLKTQRTTVIGKDRHPIDAFYEDLAEELRGSHPTRDRSHSRGRYQ